MVSFVTTPETAKSLRAQAEDALTGPNATPASVKLIQQQLADAGLYPDSWIDGEAGDITMHAAQVNADPYFARTFMEDLLTTNEDWSEADIRKAQITLTSLGLYHGDLSGKINQETAHGVLDYFPQSLSITNGRINAPALSQIVAYAEDTKVVQTMQMNPQLDYSRSSSLLDGYDDPSVPEPTEMQIKLIQSFGVATGLTSKHNIDGLNGPETTAAILADFNDQDAIISGILQKDGKLGYQDIRELQRGLSAQGQNIGFADASMGPQTAGGIMNYLSNHPDQLGKISDDNLAMLLKHGDRDDLKTLMEASPEFLHSLEADLVKLDENSGSKDILSTQIRLQALGLYELELDGDSGPGTRTAIAGFHANMQTSYALNTEEPGILSRKRLADNPIVALPKSEVKIAQLEDIPETARIAVFNPL